MSVSSASCRTHSHQLNVQPLALSPSVQAAAARAPAQATPAALRELGSVTRLSKGSMKPLQQPGSARRLSRASLKNAATPLRQMPTFHFTAGYQTGLRLACAKHLAFFTGIDSAPQRFRRRRTQAIAALPPPKSARRQTHAPAKGPRKQVPLRKAAARATSATDGPVVVSISKATRPLLGMANDSITGPPTPTSLN
jgi:hypothetical protein